MALDQNVKHIAILIHGAPELVEAAVDLEEHFVEVPPVALERGSASQAIGISLAELKAPFSDGLVSEWDLAHR